MFLICLVSFFMLGCGEDDTPTISTEDVKISITNVTKFEGNDETTFSFSIRLSQLTTQEVKMNYATREVSAGKSTDYIDHSGEIIIPVGEQTSTLDFVIVTDELKEEDEVFEVILSNAVNAVISSGTGTGTIRNDDTFVEVPDDGYITPTSYPGHTLVWSDEFEAAEINLENWTHELGDHGWGNNERQNYTANAENSFISDGKLIIEAREFGDGYTSARMVSQHKKEFMFGRIDVRAKLPFGQGIWPAIWMLGDNFATDGWPACGEIDIMELVGHEPSTVHGTAHWGLPGNPSTHMGNSYTLSGEETFNEKFHVFSLVWEANEVRWYVDDNHIHTVTPSQTAPVAYPFNDEFFFIMNIAVGGNWPGYPDETTVFPQRMIVDYVRVFQK